MDSFAMDMACVVRRLFPEEEDMDVRCLGGAKRKRNSVFTALSPSPLREIRNIPKSKGTDTTARTSSTSKGFLDINEGIGRQGEGSEIKKNLFEDEEEDDESEFDDDDDTDVGPKSPSEIFSDRFMHVLSYYPSDSEYIVIRDAILDPDNETMEALDPCQVPLSSISMEQVETIRLMIVTPTRMQTMEDMGKLILGPKFGRQSVSSGPGFWYSVLRSYLSFKQLFATEESTPRRFDMLLGFTYYLAEYPRWISHHGRGWGGEKMVAGLAMRWKHMLKYSARELLLDEEFSLPATLCLLDEFQAAVESAEMYGDPPLLFTYK
ncbi:hypothetical protein IV203_007181 [Nitzschia inconspicua]|uniref:Uncharacterized protein n=1 Tax=Nitzschia inconspicua TaxID=303405 RepID=A0A9K3PED5_9STRA|nr:hypothetical protein IV203_007181 [Nitzschia inconspicua]